MKISYIVLSVALALVVQPSVAIAEDNVLKSLWEKEFPDTARNAAVLRVFTFSPMKTFTPAARISTFETSFDYSAARRMRGATDEFSRLRAFFKAPVRRPPGEFYSEPRWLIKISKDTHTDTVHEPEIVLAIDRKFERMQLVVKDRIFEYDVPDGMMVWIKDVFGSALGPAMK